MTTLKKISWASITVLALALSACGNDDDDNDDAGPAAAGNDPAAWTQLRLLTDCDRGPAANPAFPGNVRLPAPDGPAIPENNGSGTGTSTGTGTTTSTGTSTNTVTDTSDVNMLNERMQNGNLRCEGAGGRNFTVDREGKYTMPDGSTGALEAAQIAEMRAAADALHRVDADHSVACENSGKVRDDEAIEATDGGGQLRILYTADRQGRRRCFQGDRTEIERLRAAMTPITDRYRAMGSPSAPGTPVNPSDPNAPVNPTNGGTATSTGTSTNTGTGTDTASGTGA